MSIKVENVTNNVTVDTETSNIKVTAIQPVIKVQSVGAQGKQGIQGPQGDKGDDGAPGQGVPAGGLAGQVLSKIDGTDYNTQWVDDTDTLSWLDVAGDVEYTGAETTIASGEVLTCDYKSDTIYRFINSTENANGYPIEDSFYSNFDGTSLTNLIVARG